MHSTSKLLGLAGAARDAVSADTQVKMTEGPRLLRSPEVECPGIWIRILPRQRPKSWDTIDDLVVPLERNLYGHPEARFHWERKCEQASLRAQKNSACSHVDKWTI